MGKFQLYCCGSRGSRPVEGRKFNEFGGFTTCYVLKSEDYALIIDCGTGLYEANAMILDCPVVDIVFTHVHYDHILGMLDWDTLGQNSKITFYGGFNNWFGDKTFEEFFREPFWPVQPEFVLKDTPSQGERLVLRDDLNIEFFKSPHPNQSQRMIIRTYDEDGTEHKLAVMFDNETSEGIPYDILQDSDYILYDGMFTDSEYEAKRGYGHSTWQEACRLATKVNCKKMIVTHHSPFRTDDELRDLEELARDIYPSTDFARAGQHWEFPYADSSESERKKRREKSKGDLISRFFEKFNDIILNKEQISRFIYLGTYILLGIVSIFMTVVNIFTEKTLLMYSTLIFAVCCIINVFLEIYVPKWKTGIQILFQVEMIALLTFFIVSGTPEGFSAVWALMLPVGGMIVFGKKRTTVLCAIMFAIMIFFFDTPIGQIYLQYEYTDSFMLRFPMAFCAFYLISLFLQTVMDKLNAELENLRYNQEQIIADQTSELRGQYFDIVRTNSRLQLRNKALQKMIGEDVSDEKLRELFFEVNNDELSEENKE